MHLASNLPSCFPAPLSLLALPAAPEVFWPAEAATLKTLRPVKQETLIEEHMPIVRAVAKKIYKRLPQHLEIEDLVSAGTLGLIDAVRKFEPAREVQFRSYAQFRIQGAILDSLRAMDWGSREVRRQGRTMAEAIHSLTSRLGRAPQEAEIAEEMGLTLPGLYELTGKLKALAVESLNAKRGEEDQEEIGDSVPAPESFDPLAACIQGQTREQVTAALDRLAERERLVLTLSFFEELTMKEIGYTLGVGESRVSQIRASALGKLRKHMRGAGRCSRLAA